MSEMVERPEMVKRVMDAIGVSYLEYDGSMEAMARAVIAAMREPTEDMVCRGVAVMWFKGDASNNLTISKLWPVMIDEALK